jgi:hypothetical protein
MESQQCAVRNAKWLVRGPGVVTGWMVKRAVAAR